jgi:quercetin dioxygenase-like cupin family protein
MRNLNSNHRLEVLSRSAAFSRALCAVKKIAAVVKGRQLALAAIVAAVSSVAVAAALTPPSGIVSGAVVARAGFADPVDIKFKVQEGQRQEVINVRDAQETVMQQIVIGPGGQTGWHSHPGPAVALIKAGELTLYSSEDPTCTGRTYRAGQAFVDSGQGHVHLARNLSQSQNTEVWVTYFDVPPGGPFRLDAADPGNCGF